MALMYSVRWARREARLVAARPTLARYAVAVRSYETAAGVSLLASAVRADASSMLRLCDRITAACTHSVSSASPNTLMHRLLCLLDAGRYRRG